MSLLKQSTALDKMVFMTDSADHLAGKTGLTLTITASKNGAAFASISPTVTERGNGWYSIALTSSHTDTLGDLALHVTGTAADPSDLVWQVVSGLPGETVTLAAVTHTGAVIPTVTTLTGHTPQTGDAYVRLGAPAGASVSADVAAVKAETASIQSDTNDIQTRLPAALVGGRMDSNMSAIDNQATNGNNATLNLKQLNIINNAGTALVAESTGSDGHGAHIVGNNTGKGIYVQSPSGNGVHVESVGSTGMRIESTTGGVGLYVLGGSVGNDAMTVQARGTNGVNYGIRAIGTNNGSGIRAEGNGTGSGISAVGGTTGDGIDASGGATSGKGIDANGTGGAADIEGNVTGNLSGTIGGLTASALADMFDTDSGTTFASAVAGSVVKEIADNAGGGSAPTAAQVADAVWDEARADHVSVGSFGEGVKVSSRVNMKKSTAFPGFMLTMYDSTTNLPKTGLSVTAQRAIDGGGYATCANSVSEISAGTYKIDLSAGDLNGNCIKLKFTSSGALQQDFTVVTQE